MSVRVPRFPVALSLAIGLLCAPAARAADFDARKVDAVVAEAMKAFQVPGAAVVVVKGDEVLYLKGHGVRELGGDRPVTPDTVFPLASCSKAFTTTLMAMLADEGKLAWDDPVRKHLPDFKLADPVANADVRLRDLVTHRTGVAPHDLLWYRAAWGTDEMIRRVGRVPPSKPFRAAFQYQSVMFTAAGKAAGRAADKPWADLVRERIFEPLGMKSASVRTSDALKAADHAGGHRKTKDGKVEPVPWYKIEEPNPAGSVNASARDLVPWLRLHLNGGAHGGTQLVSEENLGETHTPQTVIRMDAKAKAMHPDTVQLGYGMGWVVQDHRGHKLVSHAGAIDGFRAHLTLVPEAKVGIAVLSNLQETRMNLAVSTHLAELLLGLEPRDWNKIYLDLAEQDAYAAKARARRQELARQKNTTPRKPLADYAGTYEDPAYGTAKVRFEKGQLVWEWSTFRCPLEHYQFDTFRLTGDDFLGGSLLEFTFDESGAVGGLRVIDVDFRRAKGGR